LQQSDSLSVNFPSQSNLNVTSVKPLHIPCPQSLPLPVLFASITADDNSRNEFISNDLNEFMTPPSSFATLPTSQNASDASSSQITPSTTSSAQNINILPQNRSPNYYSLYNILSKYIKSAKSLETAIAKIESLPSNGFFLFNEIVNSITLASRPDAQAKKRILDELQESQIFIVTELKRMSFKIERGNNFK